MELRNPPPDHITAGVNALIGRHVFHPRAKHWIDVKKYINNLKSINFV